MPSNPMPYISPFDPGRGWFPITDADIDGAVPFEGHHRDYLSWPRHLWSDPEKGVPCWDRAKNAYHILYLARAMMRTRSWVGHPMILWQGGKAIAEGQHRYRAVQYRADRYGVRIEVPVLPMCLPAPIPEP